MALDALDSLEKKGGKELYDYQQSAIDKIFNRIDTKPENYNLLFQLPTGGGKTVIFSELARQYLHDKGKKVLILTHRIELCGQTSKMLNEFGVKNKIINSKVKEFPDQHEYHCFVAMVETLNNRLKDDKLELDKVGLVIIDEAHYNSFRKLFKYFENSFILGVTATPLSSNIKLPMKDNYNELIVGHSIASLIEKGFLAKGITYSYDVSLRSLKVGINGDYTVASSEQLYSNYTMQEKLLYAYEQKSKDKKTLIFNNGIRTSLQVFETFKEAGYDIRHLDNTHGEVERRDILEWFRTNPKAILSSVGILTTGFDEPTVDTIILNRATKSLTLYHQMIGRGSRVLPNKKIFNVIDIGNNALRFGLWECYTDWQDIFVAPNSYLENILNDVELEKQFVYEMPDEMKLNFPKSTMDPYDIKEEYSEVINQGLRPMTTINRSIEQHTKICIENSEDVFDALLLTKLLEEEIRYRVKTYSYCISKSTDNYIKWLIEEYNRKLQNLIRQSF